MGLWPRLLPLVEPLPHRQGLLVSLPRPLVLPQVAEVMATVAGYLR